MKTKNEEKKQYEEARISLMVMQMENVMAASVENEEDSGIETPPIRI